MKSKSWPWAEVIPHFITEFDEPFWLSGCSAESKSLEFSSLADWCCNGTHVPVQYENSVYSCKTSLFLLQNLFLVFFLLFMQSRTDCSIGECLSSHYIFSSVEVFVFHVLQKIRLIFLKWIDLFIAPRRVSSYEL